MRSISQSDKQNITDYVTLLIDNFWQQYTGALQNSLFQHGISLTSMQYPLHFWLRLVGVKFLILKGTMSSAVVLRTLFWIY